MKWQRFPTETLPEPVRALVKAAALAMQCDESFIALPLLAVLAATIGATRRIQLHPGWYEPAILWTAIVGESGTLKTPALRLALKPLREIQAKSLTEHEQLMSAYQDELARWERDNAAWKKSKSLDDPPTKPVPPPQARTVVSDTTIEALAPILRDNPRGVLLVRDELAGWIGGFDRYTGRHGGDVAHWLSTYTGEDFLFDRKTSGTIYVPRAHVCIAGGIQPEILRRALGDEHFFNGLAARLLLVMPPRRRRRWSKAGLAPQLEAEFALLIERLRELQSETIEGEAEPVALRLDAAADGLWCDYFDRHNREQVLLNGPLASAWSKLEGGAARLALVIHLTKWAAEMPVSNTHIDESSMLAGIALAEWFKSETKRVYAALAEGDGEAELHALERFIQKCDGSVTVNDVTHGIRRYRNKTTEAREALNTLAERGRGRWVDPKPSPKGGKPTVRFELVPIVTVTDTATGDNAVGGIGDSDASDNSDVGVVE